MENIKSITHTFILKVEGKEGVVIHPSTKTKNKPVLE